MEMRYGREVIVGTLVLLAIAGFIFGTMWLTGRSPSSSDLVNIRFANVTGLKRASQVHVSGVAVGRVELIEFRGVGDVIVSVSVGDRVSPRVDAKAQIVSVSLVGEYAVDLDPGTGAPLPRGAIIQGTRQVGFTETASGLSGRADTVLMGLQQMVSPEMVRQLQSTMAGLEATMQSAQRTMALYGNANSGPTAELTRTMVQFRQLGARLDSTLANPALQRTLSGSDTLTANFSAMAKAFAGTGARLDTLLARMNAGQGSLGKLATDSSLYYGMVKLTAQLDSLMATIKKDPGKVPITVRIF
jgi:phospholipid/cholesterol/gamma-HCH transport system substrate-binding protein